jgi:hypothetical protein
MLNWRHCALVCPELFGDNTGVLTEEGEKWQEIRSKVQQDMMRPQSALFFTEKLQEVGNDFVEYVERKLQTDRTNPGDFLRDLQESIPVAIT